MITANVPSAKKIIVHGPDSASGGIPSQFPIHEDTQFQQIFTDSLEFFNIEQELDHYFLVDAKTGLVHAPGNYVRYKKVKFCSKIKNSEIFEFFKFKII